MKIFSIPQDAHRTHAAVSKLATSNYITSKSYALYAIVLCTFNIGAYPLQAAGKLTTKLSRLEISNGFKAAANNLFNATRSIFLTAALIVALAISIFIPSVFKLFKQIELPPSQTKEQLAKKLEQSQKELQTAQQEKEQIIKQPTGAPKAPQAVLQDDESESRAKPQLAEQLTKLQDQLQVVLHDKEQLAKQLAELQEKHKVVIEEGKALVEQLDDLEGKISLLEHDQASIRESAREELRVYSAQKKQALLAAEKAVSENGLLQLFAQQKAHQDQKRISELEKQIKELTLRCEKLTDCFEETTALAGEFETRCNELEEKNSALEKELKDKGKQIQGLVDRAKGRRDSIAKLNRRLSTTREDLVEARKLSPKKTPAKRDAASSALSAVKPGAGGY